MNAKTYYSSFVQTSSSSSLDYEADNNSSDGARKSIPCSRSSSSCLDTIPSWFYRIASVGQDNRLCLWDITDDVLKFNPNSKPNSSSSSNPFTPSPSSSSDVASSTQASAGKPSFSSLTSRLSFARNSNKINKSSDDAADSVLSAHANGASKKSRKLSLLPSTLTGTKSPTSSSSSSAKAASHSDDANHESLSVLTASTNSSSSRRTNFDLTKSTFGTNLCPKLDDIQVIEPVIAEFIAHERLNGIYFGENYLLTSSQDGIIAIWEKPQKLLSATNVRALAIRRLDHRTPPF